MQTRCGTVNHRWLYRVAVTAFLFASTLFAHANPHEALPRTTTKDCPPTLGTGEESKALGIKEIERSDGGKDKIYYSITTAEEEARRQQEEKEKLDRSMEMLRNIIIDQRKR